MSVEEARAEIHTECDPPSNELSHEAASRYARMDSAIDRLILEVQAAMPCSNYYAAEMQEGNCFDLGEYCEADGWPPPEAYEPCPSCTARLKLKETSDAR